MRVVVLLALLGLGVSAWGAAYAIGAGEALSDPALEARARAIGKELRCLVCQNQSIDDSDADLAKDLRRIVRERLSDGDSDEAVKAYVVARYGDFVLLKPPFKPATFALWLGPAILLVLGAAGVGVYLRRQGGSAVAAEALTAADRERLDNLLDNR